MNRRFIAVFVVLVFCFALLAPMSALAAVSLSNFGVIRGYDGEFSDISGDEWYYYAVKSVYERGLMNGKTGGVFDPYGTLTIAESIALAACLHKGYFTGSYDFGPGSPWYAPYVEYCREQGLAAGGYRNYLAPVSRADFAAIVGGAVPDEAVTPINRIADGAIPDVAESYSYGPAVYKLYRAGVITGSGTEGAYYPGRSIMRAEAAVLVMRILDADTRVEFSLAAELTGEQIYKLASPAVFYIEVFDEDGESIKTGSGFFISEAGMAVTNYHVIVGGSSARITTDGGEEIDIVGVYDYDWKKDTALIKVEGGGFPYLELADSDKLQTGATVYTLGSPLGLQASFSRGIVSQSSREIEGVEYIQIDAPISSGSSGGALLDSRGRAVGVTSATAVDAQNINLSMPINVVRELNRGAYVTMKAILKDIKYYADKFPAPDFGAYFGVRPFNTETVRNGTAYSYRLSDLDVDAETAIDEYTDLLWQNLFILTGYSTHNDEEFEVYYNSMNGILVTFGIETIKEQECVTVIV